MEVFLYIAMSGVGRNVFDCEGSQSLNDCGILYIEMTGVGQNVFYCEGPYIEYIYFFWGEYQI